MLCYFLPAGGLSLQLFLKIRNKSSPCFGKPEFALELSFAPGESADGDRFGTALSLRHAAAMGPCRLARPRRRPGPQPFDLAPRQRDADFPDPFQLHSRDGLGVEAGEIDHGRGFSPVDGFQIALARLQPDRRLFAVEA